MLAEQEISYTCPTAVLASEGALGWLSYCAMFCLTTLSPCLASCLSVSLAYCVSGVLWLLVGLKASVHLQVQALQQAVMKIGEHLSGGQGAAGQGEQPQGDTKPEGEGEKKDEQK